MAWGKIKQTCKECGREFEVPLSKIKIGHGIFCSHSCANKGENHPSWKGGEITKLCKMCNAKFEVYPSLIKIGKGNYCCYKCARKARKGFPKHHTKPELIFEEICERYNLPFQYVGDSQLWIGKKGGKQLNPDFVEYNGNKIVVEIFGDCWHSPLLNRKMKNRDALPYRKKHFKRYKWQPVFLWETDLLREDAEAFVLITLKKERVI